jgi:MFS family permease
LQRTRRRLADVAELVGWVDVVRGGTVGRILGATAFVDAAGTGVFMASIAIFLVTLAGLSVDDVGFGFSLAGFAGFAATIPMTAVSARVGPRAFFFWTSLVRVVAFLLYLAVGSLAAFAAVASLVSVASAGWFPTQQALIGSLLADEDRVKVMASVRAVRNLGYAVGGLGATAALALGGRPAFVTVVVANAASYALCAWLYAKLPRVETEVAAARRRVPALRDPRYVGLMLTSVVFGLSLVLLQIGIPLWVAKRTDAPHALAGAVVVVNTLLVVLLQVRAARGSETVAGATKLLRASAVGFAICCGLFAAAGKLDPVTASIAIVAGAVALTWGEMLESAAWWTVSFELAPAERRAEYLGVFSLNYEIVFIAGPTLMALLVNSGLAGWGVLAALFLAAALAARLLVKGATERPRGLSAERLAGE